MRRKHKFQFKCHVEGCAHVVHGETRDEVLQAAAEHARHAHGLGPLGPETIEMVRAGITATSG